MQGHSNLDMSLVQRLDALHLPPEGLRLQCGDQEYCLSTVGSVHLVGITQHEKYEGLYAGVGEVFAPDETDVYRTCLFINPDGSVLIEGTMNQAPVLWPRMKLYEHTAAQIVESAIMLYER